MSQSQFSRLAAVVLKEVQPLSSHGPSGHWDFSLFKMPAEYTPPSHPQKRKNRALVLRGSLSLLRL